MTSATGREKLALCGGEKTVTLATPAWPVVGEQEKRWMAEVVASGNWSWLGEHEMAFCKEYAEYIGTKYCIALANGTVTLQCALQAVGVQPGDEVIVPGLTWVATAQAAMDIGANVVLVDIDPETLCISPEAIRAALTPRTKAIIPVHLYGCMCDMDAIMDIARQHNLKVVEDVAHQQGSRWRDKCAGAIGDAGSYSFQQSKILTCGEGGAVTCNDEEVYRCIFALKQVGWAPDPKQPFEPGVRPCLVPGNRYGHNYRMTEMQAVLLRGGLSRLEEQNRIREENAQLIGERLSAMGAPLRLARRDPRITRQAYYALTLHYEANKLDGLPRHQFSAALGAEGCGMGAPYEPVYRSGLLSLYDGTSPLPYREASGVQDYANLRLANVERACSETSLLINQQRLLGSRAYLDQLLQAIRKVCDYAGQVKDHFAQQE